MRHALILALVISLPAPALAAPSADLEVARGVLEDALKKHPGNAELHTLLGFVFRKMDRFEEAAASFASATKANPRKAEAHYMLGMLHEKAGRKAEARAAWKACLDAATEPGMKETAQRHLSLLEKAAP
jgi:cytochrome c-type biogenesis protein CcmH/NrfG